MKRIQFFFHNDLHLTLNEERLDLILVMLAFNQKVILNVSEAIKGTISEEINKSKLYELVKDNNLEIFYRKNKSEEIKADLKIDCVD